MLVTKTMSGKDLIVLGERALVGSLYIDIKTTYNDAWSELIGESEVTELHQLLSDNPDKWGDNESDWKQAVTHSNSKVRTLLAQHAKSLNLLKNDSSVSVREAVVSACFSKLKFGCGSNQEYYQGIIKELLNNCFNDDGIIVACAIASRAEECHIADYVDVMEQLAKHPAHIVRENVARYSKDSNLLEQLSFDSDELVRVQVALNSKTTRGVLERLLADTSELVKCYAKVA